MHLRIFSEDTHNSVWHLRSRIKEWVQWPSQYKTSTHHSCSANCLLRQLIFYREGWEQTSLTFWIFVKWISMCSLTLLSLNSLKYSLGVATAAAGEPVVLIMSLNSLKAASLSRFLAKILESPQLSFSNDNPQKVRLLFCYFYSITGWLWLWSVFASWVPLLLSAIFVQIPGLSSLEEE